MSTYETLRVESKPWGLSVTLNRPKLRNAMNLTMVDELRAVFSGVAEDQQIRAVVLRGAEGHFCAGGDVKEMGALVGGGSEVSARQMNRRFGQLLQEVQAAPAVVICVLEGAVLGGGFGLACVSDVALAHEQATFGLPETGLGIVPAQIAPFVVARIGLMKARRLALLGMRFRGKEALELGVVHEVHEDLEALDVALQATLQHVARCAPTANRVTKALMLRVGAQALDHILDDAAEAFEDCLAGDEGQEGTRAFVERRKPQWVEDAGV